MVVAVCPRCARSVALHEGRPSVSATGAVGLWHPSCWELRAAPIIALRAATGVTVTPPFHPRRARWIAAGIVAVSALALAADSWLPPLPPASLAAVDLDEPEALATRTRDTAREEAPPAPVETTLEARYPVPTWNGAALTDLYPSLVGWTHPVTASAELVPELDSRHFGAERIGVERPECGRGHCGLDLDGPRGRPLVAVADGVIVRVERHELGLDGKSGRYVRIEHDDGTLTSYMHMDEVAEALEVGDHVDAGQYLGTLGATAVYSAAPHLHFALEVPARPGQHGDHVTTHYVDPAPFLARATIVAAPDRRRATKPAM